MTRPTLERIAWLRTPRRDRSKGTSVRMNVEGKTKLVPLASLTMSALKKYAESLGIKS